MEITETLFRSLLAFVPDGTKINVTRVEADELKKLPEFNSASSDENHTYCGRIGSIQFFLR